MSGTNTEFNSDSGRFGGEMNLLLLLLAIQIGQWQYEGKYNYICRATGPQGDFTKACTLGWEVAEETWHLPFSGRRSYDWMPLPEPELSR
jgi:hypothetical protein